ncbi:DNA-3-methyladenine glycosylase I [Aureimonas populi]|uniref:DNA-3-methyladenine glycosylase I n=1 Tax=Aureimonas populi TaxID=1701758 RepID=A0ABW5CIR4_9HYPH|nr:DNA-3-methyladenine glycosylase I [Aureimonas populi]
MNGLLHGADGTARCAWAGGDALYGRYHDHEWGRPQGGRRALYEKLCLEGFQAGLSWITILRKREAFRALFEGFEVERVAAMGEAEIDRIAADARIIRHRGKVASTVNNARAVIALEQKEGRSFAAFLWSFEPGREERPDLVTREWVAANTITPASARLSKALKHHGFSFVGPTTCHAFMEAMGFVNDHVEGCACRAPCEEERAAFERPR